MDNQTSINGAENVEVQKIYQIIYWSCGYQLYTYNELKEPDNKHPIQVEKRFNFQYLQPIQEKS